jgi:hypothetical protein
MSTQAGHSVNPPKPAASYEHKPPLELAGTAGLKGAGAGLLVSAVQNALDTHSRGAMGVLTRTGGTVGLFGEHFEAL